MHIELGNNSRLEEAIELFEFGYGRKLTPVERNIFKAGYYAGRGA